jgi:hypothetical protein
MVALDLHVDPSLASPRPQLDVILLKMTDELVKVATDADVAKEVENARKLITLYPNAVLVDSIDSQALTIDRASMHHFFDKINALPQGTVSCPRIHFLLSYLLRSLSPLHWMRLDSHSFPFPFFFFPFFSL